MKNKITKQVKEELKQILDNTGYWSKETRDFLSQFDYPVSKKLHQIAQVYNKYNYGL